MTDSAATLMAVIFGIAVFSVIVVIGWRSVQHRRIVRMRGADGHETIIVAGEDDEISSIETTTTEAAPAASPSASSVADGDAAPTQAPEFGRGAPKGEVPI